MSPELENKLYTAYPKIFQQASLPMTQTAMCWGFCCGDGWYDLIDTLCHQLQFDTDVNRYPQVQASQVKEKFGTLRFYVDGANENQWGMIHFAELMSSKICDVCGEKGSRNSGGWISTRCSKHKDEE